MERTTPEPTSSLGFLEMKLYSSPDYKSPLDPSSKVQTDKRVYAEVDDSHVFKVFYIYSTYIVTHDPSLQCSVTSM